MTHPFAHKEMENGEGTKVIYGSCGMQAWRWEMEETCFSYVDIEHNINLFGVFDGYGGKQVALYVKDHF